MEELLWWWWDSGPPYLVVLAGYVLSCNTEGLKFCFANGALNDSYGTNRIL